MTNKINVALADDNEHRIAETNNTGETIQIDLSKRALFGSGLGVLSALLTACGERDIGDGVTHGGMPGSGASKDPFASRGTGTIDPSCGCMPPGSTTPAPGTGGTLPPAGGATPTPTPNGVITVANGIQQYTALGPGSAFALSTADVMAGPSVAMSDGRVVPVWGFFPSGVAGALAFNNDRVNPAPTLICTEGSTVAITLSSMHPHTIHLHGLDVSQANDGVPATSGYVGGSMMGGVSPIGRVAGYTSLGGSYTYQFIAPKAGTYMYHCHVDTVLHMEMGMSGTIIVRPSDGAANRLWINGPIFNKEYIWQLHTFDSNWHALQTSTAGVTFRYKPDYFLINGSDGAKLLVDPTVAVKAAVGEIVVIRLVNFGYLPALVRLGGIAFDIVASDGRPLQSTISGVTDVMVNAGERYDVMFTMPPGGATLPATVDYLNIMGTGVLGTAGTTITQV